MWTLVWLFCVPSPACKQNKVIDDQIQTIRPISLLKTLYIRKNIWLFFMNNLYPLVHSNPNAYVTKTGLSKKNKNLLLVINVAYSFNTLQSSQGLHLRMHNFNVKWKKMQSSVDCTIKTVQNRYFKNL